jgi:hypothetical protein
VNISHAGPANIALTATQLDLQGAGGKEYAIHFAPSFTIAKGNFQSTVALDVVEGVTPDAGTYAVIFRSPTTYSILSITKSRTLRALGTFTSGTPIILGGAGLRLTITDVSTSGNAGHAAGDSIVVQPGVVATSGGTTVLELQPFAYGTSYVTTDGAVFSIVRNNDSTSSLITYSDSFTFSTVAAQVRTSLTNGDLSNVKVVPNPYLVGSAYEIEYGILRKEPIRQLKFNHLPTHCTITIFTMAGDKVKVLYHDGTTGTETWDLRTDGNRVIAAGMYVYLVKTDRAEKLGRFAVIK